MIHTIHYRYGGKNDSVDVSNESMNEKVAREYAAYDLYDRGRSNVIVEDIEIVRVESS